MNIEYIELTLQQEGLPAKDFETSKRVIDLDVRRSYSSNGQVPKEVTHFLNIRPLKQIPKDNEEAVTQVFIFRWRQGLLPRHAPARGLFILFIER